MAHPLFFPWGSAPEIRAGVRGFPFLLYGTGVPSGAPPEPTCLAGLRYFHGSVKELCLVPEAEAPTGMGGVWKVRKAGGTFAVYLVETSDPNASEVRIRTSAGIKAARKKT